MRNGNTVINSNVGQAINSANLENLILELNNDVDNISIILRNIETIMYNVQDCINGPVGDVLINKLDIYKRQFDLLKNNLLSYPDDLLALKNSVESNDLYAVEAMADLSQDIIEEAKKITNRED